MSKWTKAEEQYLKENYSKINVTEIMKHLNRSYLSVKKKAHYVGLEKDIYEGGFFFSTGDVMKALGMSKSTVSYYVRMKYIKCRVFKSFNKNYKKFSVENIVDFMCRYPEKWLNRSFDIDTIQMLLLEYNGGQAKVRLIKELISAPPSFWRTKVKAHSQGAIVSTLDEKIKAI